jgi:imidazolonepropionase-like amidohydrolase
MTLRWLLLLSMNPLLAPSGFGQDLVLTRATLIDGTGAAPQPNRTLVIRGGKIVEITASAESPSGETLDLGGRYLLPGLIDAHAHILTPEAARRALLSGVTTARVLGDLYFQALGTRDLIRRGHAEGPELLCSAGHVRPRLGTPFFVAFPQFGQYLSGELRGASNVAAVVRAVLDKGADVIKVGASERAGLATTDPRRQELTLEEMQAAVREAAKDGKWVAAHAHAQKGAHDAVRAGVRSIEHGTYLNGETLDLMKEKGTYLVPTLAIMSPLGDPRSDGEQDVALRIRTWHMQPAIRAVARKAREKGIMIAAATDGSYGDGDDTARVRVQHDMEEMLACGFTPMEAIAAATRNGARVLGIDSRTGTLAPGMEADLMAVDRNPLEDFRAIYEPLLVINNGKVSLNRIY